MICFFGENCSQVEPLNFGEVNQDLVVVGEDGEKHCLSGTYEDSVNGTCTTWRLTVYLQQ